MTTDAILLNELDYNQKLTYISNFNQVKKSKAIGFFMALIFGCVGAHHFYMGNWRLGVLYILLWCTGIPAFIGWVEMFFMPARVGGHNTRESIRIIQEIKGATP